MAVGCWGGCALRVRAIGMHPTWGLVGGGDRFEGPSRDVRGDALTCSGLPYMFI